MSTTMAVKEPRLTGRARALAVSWAERTHTDDFRTWGAWWTNYYLLLQAPISFGADGAWELWTRAKRVYLTSNGLWQFDYWSVQRALGQHHQPVHHVSEAIQTVVPGGTVLRRVYLTQHSYLCVDADMLDLLQEVAQPTAWAFCRDNYVQPDIPRVVALHAGEPVGALMPVLHPSGEIVLVDDEVTA